MPVLLLKYKNVFPTELLYKVYYKSMVKGKKQMSKSQTQKFITTNGDQLLFLKDFFTLRVAKRRVIKTQKVIRGFITRIKTKKLKAVRHIQVIYKYKKNYKPITKRQILSSKIYMMKIEENDLVKQEEIENKAKLLVIQTAYDKKLVEAKANYLVKVIEFCKEKEIIKCSDDEKTITITPDKLLNLFEGHYHHDIQKDFVPIPYELMATTTTETLKKITSSKIKKAPRKQNQKTSPVARSKKGTPENWQSCDDITGCMARHINGGHRRCMAITSSGEALCVKCKKSYDKPGNKKLRDGWWGVIGENCNNAKGFTTKHAEWSAKQYFSSGNFQDNRPAWVKAQYPLE